MESSALPWASSTSPSATRVVADLGSSSTACRNSRAAASKSPLLASSSARATCCAAGASPGGGDWPQPVQAHSRGNTTAPSRTLDCGPARGTAFASETAGCSRNIPGQKIGVCPPCHPITQHSILAHYRGRICRAVDEEEYGCTATPGEQVRQLIR